MQIAIYFSLFHLTRIVIRLAVLFIQQRIATDVLSTLYLSGVFIIDF